MKKILLVVVLATIGLVSCKKEELTKPVTEEKVMGGKKEDMGEWE